MTKLTRLVFVGLLLMLTLSACTNLSVNNESNNHVDTEGRNNKVNSKGTEQNVVPEEKTSPSSQDITTTDDLKAINNAHELLEFIKEKDGDKLLRLLNKSDRSRLDIEGALTIIKAFEINFDLDTLSVQINENGLAMNPEGGQYEFVLVDKNFKEAYEENSLVIHYQEDGGIVYHNPYIRYFPYAEKMVHQYLDLIDEGNTTELASFLNPDDVDVPDWVADEIIRNYKNFFNSENKSVRYKNRFTFVIEDSDGKGKEHTIEVIYGDGLMSIQDDFKPDF